MTTEKIPEILIRESFEEHPLSQVAKLEVHRSAEYHYGVRLSIDSPIPGRDKLLYGWTIFHCPDFYEMLITAEVGCRLDEILSYFKELLWKQLVEEATEEQNDKDSIQ